MTVEHKESVVEEGKNRGQEVLKEEMLKELRRGETGSVRYMERKKDKMRSRGGK